VADIETFDMDESEFLQILSSVENNSNHPIAKSILNRFKADNIKLANEGKEDLQLLAVDDFENVTGKGLKANVSIGGVNSPVLAGNLKLMESEGVEVSEEVLNKFNDFVSDAKTTIVMAVNGEVKGIITLMDKIKDSSKPAIDHLHKMGIETYMLTGDNEKTASAVANAVGIDNIMANVLPNDKLYKVQELQKDRKRVLFVGDGINDAPALSQADVGVAMGNGTDIAMESGDIVIMEGDLENVVASIQFSKKVMTRIKENLFWAFAYNMILVPVAAGILYPIWGIIFRPEWAGLAMALSSVTVISLSLLLKRYVPPIKKQVA
jgi:Cu+-exporting ATPase